MTASAANRRSRILQQAEKLFADHGFAAVSMRDIAEAAGVSVALLTYHFATKDGLYRAVFEARQGVIDERVRGAREVDLSSRGALAALVAAWIEPQMKLRETEDGLNFARLVAREAADPSSENRGIISEFFDPPAREIVAKLHTLLPDVPLERLTWCFLLAVGAMSMSVFDERVGRIGGDPDMSLAEKTALLEDFIMAGLKGPPARRAARAKRA